MAAFALRNVSLLHGLAQTSSKFTLRWSRRHQYLVNFGLEDAVRTHATCPSGNTSNSRQRWQAVPRQRFPHWSYSSVRSEVHHVSAAVTTGGPVARLADDKKSVWLEGLKEHPLCFNATWLRLNCHCDTCRQAHSGQVLIEPADLRPPYTIRDVGLQDGVLTVTWAEDDHVGRIPVSHLKSCDFSQDAKRKAAQERVPNVCKGWLPTCDYSDVTSSPQGLWSWVDKLNDYGLCVVKGVPTHPGAIREAVELIWPIQRTIYGEIFQVVSTPKPINVAYSSSHLGFHMDLVYYESPPGFQFLLCQQFDSCVEGGESLLVDAWAVAEDMRIRHPDQFAVLTRVPATFQKIHYDRESPVHMIYRRPHVVLGTNNKVTAINWAPAFEGPLEAPEEDIEPYYKAYQLFAEMLEASETRSEFHLEPGDLLSFNNRRILHGRRGFTLNGGMRALEGCYLNIDEFKSRAEVLSHQCGDSRPAKDVFNQCLL